MAARVRPWPRNTPLSPATSEARCALTTIKGGATTIAAQDSNAATPEARVETWVVAWGDRITRFAHSLTLDPALAQDVAQETFLRLLVWQRQHPLADPGPAWLFTVARNVAIDQLRRRRTSAVREQASAPTDPDLAQRLAVRDAVAALPPGDRACLWLFYYGDLSVAEIGSTLHLSPTAVKARLHRARRRFAAIWDGAVAVPATGGGSRG